MNSARILDDYGRALMRLDDALQNATDNEVYRAGCIQYFEFCFELAWKSVKCVAEQSGAVESVSPRACIKYAFSAGWIGDEEVWLAMLAARNLMTHTYDILNAGDVVASLPRFLVALQQLHAAI